MIDPELFVVVFTIIIGICLVVQFISDHMKRDGKLTINDSMDSWTITITTNPEEIKRKKRIVINIDRQ